MKEATSQIAEVKQLYRNDQRYRQLLDYAIALEGLSRHAGVHAAGIVIAPGPLDEYVPVCTQSSKGAGGSRDDESIVVTQYDMNALEKAGMLKMDFLGLTTLTIIHDALGLDRGDVGHASRISTSCRSMIPRPTGSFARDAPPACSSSSPRSPPTCSRACAATASTISSHRTR